MTGRAMVMVAGFVLMIVAIPLAVVYRSGPDWHWLLNLMAMVGFVTIYIGAMLEHTIVEDEIACKLCLQKR